MLELIQFPSAWGLPNPSPFCLKLEAWLSLQKLEYRIRSEQNPKKSPTGKLPCLKDGPQVLADSERILRYLEAKTGRDLDQGLSSAQRAEGVAFKRMLEHHLYWIMVYFRWQDPAGQVLTLELFRKIPPGLRQLVTFLALRNVRAQLFNQGTSRHRPEDLVEFGREDLKALSDRLGDSPYFYDQSPRMLDLVAFSFTANLFWPPHRNGIYQVADEFPNLEAHAQRVWKACFPDRDLPPGARS